MNERGESYRIKDFKKPYRKKPRKRGQQRSNKKGDAQKEVPHYDCDGRN
jgi:hypothetical protein